MHLLKPKVVQDIYHPEKSSPFRVARVRLNLRHTREWRLPIKKVAHTAIALWTAWALVLGAVVAPTTTQTTLAATSGEERAQLEAQLKELESQIGQYENQIVGYQKQGKSLKGEITTLNSKIAKLTLQIKAIDLTLKELDRKLADTQNEIQSTEASLTSNKKNLGELVSTLHQNDQASLMEVFLSNPKLSDFFGDLNSISLVQSNIRQTIGQIQNLQAQLKDQKEQYALARADASTVKAYQSTQKVEVDNVKKTKNTLLATTQGQETKYQALLKETKATAAQIRQRIFQLLGGGQLDFGTAYQYAKAASDATGVRPAMILAVLDRESALGKNVGGCTYTTAMSPSNRPIFLQITSELGLNPTTTKVSCANADGAYGGAMGPAQFIPSTWVLYKDRIAKLTGHAPSPWNNADAFVATGLYLADAGAGGSVENDRKAAAKYYAGGNWSRFLWTYGQAVVSKAAQFEEDIATLAGNSS